MAKVVRNATKMANAIELWPLTRLVPYDKNPRTHSEDQVAKIAASIAEFGFVNPILVDTDDGIIAGHGRLQAATKLGLDEVPVIVLDHLTPTQRRAYVIADNKLAELAGWDESLLQEELKALEAEAFDLELIGFGDEELQGLLEEPSTVQGKTDDDSAPEPPVDPVTRLGDLWVLGKHRLLCGDSTSIDAVDRLMDGDQAEMVFTDPPYGVSFQSGMSKGGTATRFDKLKNDDVRLEIFPVVYGALQENAAAFIWTSHQVYPEWRAQFEEIYKGTIVWHKPGGGIGDLTGNYATDYELCLFCAKGRPEFRSKRGMAVWKVSKDPVLEYKHPTQKPVELAERAIGDFTDSGNRVLDLFGGSGSTLIACEKTNRKARLMELDPKYCDVILQRWADFTGKDPAHENGTKFSDLKSRKHPIAA